MAALPLLSWELEMDRQNVSTIMHVESPFQLPPEKPASAEPTADERATAEQAATGHDAAASHAAAPSVADHPERNDEAEAEGQWVFIESTHGSGLLIAPEPASVIMGAAARHRASAPMMRRAQARPAARFAPRQHHHHNAARPMPARGAAFAAKLRAMDPPTAFAAFMGLLFVVILLGVAVRDGGKKDVAHYVDQTVQAQAAKAPRSLVAEKKAAPKKKSAATPAKAKKKDVATKGQKRARRN